MISALILAGGKSSRMNFKHKALLSYDHRNFLEKLLDTFNDFEKTYYSINKDQNFNFNNGIKIVDSFNNIGPISGIYECMLKLKEKYLFITPCDCPNISKELITYILGYVSSDYDAFIIKDSKGFIHPLIGVYSKNILPIITEMINEKDYKILNILNKINVKYIDLSQSKFNDTLIKNINTEKDYLSLTNDIQENIPFIAISGIKNSGKTTLICKLLKKFKELNYKVGTIKHDGHDFQMDNIDSDTDKHIKNGACGSLIFSKSKLMFLEKNKEQSLSKYFEYFNNYDFLILEGFKNSNYPKVEIIRKEISENYISKKNILFYASNCDEILNDSKINSIDLNDTNKIFNEILKYLTRRK